MSIKLNIRFNIQIKPSELIFGWNIMLRFHTIVEKKNQFYRKSNKKYIRQDSSNIQEVAIRGTNIYIKKHASIKRTEDIKYVIQKFGTTIIY